MFQYITYTLQKKKKKLNTFSSSDIFFNYKQLTDNFVIWLKLGHPQTIPFCIIDVAISWSARVAKS